jgi:sugar lactone lactonase YvrE
MAGAGFVVRFLQPCAVVVVLGFIAACGGGGGGGDSGSPPVVPSPRLALFAGSLGGPGNSDGIGANARFTDPYDVAVDSKGNVYAVDYWNYAIRKIAPGGVTTTFAGTVGQWGYSDGLGSEARLLPRGIAVDKDDVVWVADSSLIRRITPDGMVSTVAGWPGSWTAMVDGIGANARFMLATSIAVDAESNALVGDSCAIRKVTPAGAVTTLAGSSNCGWVDGQGSDAQFAGPEGIAVGRDRNLYVADSRANTIRRVTPTGLVTTFAGDAVGGVSGSADGTLADARFNSPRGIAADHLGNFYVSDGLNETVRKITPAGFVSTLAGTAGLYGAVDAAGADARFYWLRGMTTDSSGNVYVADQFNCSIRKVTPEGVVTTVAGAARQAGGSDGAGSAARFESPSGIAADAAGTVYVVDTWNSTLRRVTRDGLVTTLAGTPGAYGYADGSGSNAKFGFCFYIPAQTKPYYPGGARCFRTGVATDAVGNVLLADLHNGAIRRITPDGLVTTLISRTDIQPHAVATDGKGNIYFASTSQVWKVMSTGEASVLAGQTVGGANDGVGAHALFNWPYGITTDASGNLYVADTLNHTIRKITPAGEVSTLAGRAGVEGSEDGAGAAARFRYPYGIASDTSGNLYVADTENHTIRKVTPAGVVTTVVGAASVTGFTPGALPGVLASPQGIAVSGKKLYVTLYDGVAVVTDLP